MIKILKKPNVFACIMCAAGVALNILLSHLVSLFHLPLYLDTVGTISVAIMGGYVPGMVVGFITNLINICMDPAALYYGFINVLIAVFAAFLSGRGWHKSRGGVVGMMGIFALFGGSMGSVLPLLIEGLSYNTGSFGRSLARVLSLDPTAAQIVATFLQDVPDKAISVLLAVLIIHLLPDDFHERFRFVFWRQNPLSDEEVKNIEKTHVRGISLQNKVLFTLSSSLLVVSVVALWIGTSVYSSTLIRRHIELAQGTTVIAASVLDADRIDDYLQSDGKEKDYIKTETLLRTILNSSADITYLYVYKIEEDGCHVVYDLETGGKTGEEIGTVIPFDEGILPYYDELMAGRFVEPIITNDTYGYLMTAYYPVYDSHGFCVCYVGADVDMKQLNGMMINFLAEMTSVFLAFFFLITIVGVWLARVHVILPINAIESAMDRLSLTADTQESMDNDVKMFRRLGIRTGDELENLFISACAMTKNQAEQMRSIRRLSESTAKMQDGLIITMADLVESRDSDTGAHVQKTAAYVKIIVEGLKKKGYYPEKITPKFMSDVVRSAPLHDVGKIKIPDEILNKPGKLTDEEFEIMKSHTTEGKRIMENAISTVVEGDNYLKEARNMAAYHHERWDGKGYPEGIHGEVIPLSARIMAVADVFDALTSPRVYKPAFSLEKAISIMEEGKGTQFDPKCLEVFFEALPEVKVILRKYNRDM
ncbi:MAG: HD domain-containing protein [Lachnospiraceae bacterium]|nr:HD domain-containing protein [Lachnospiraceae bacterium]